MRYKICWKIIIIKIIIQAERIATKMKIKQIQTYLDDLWNHMKQKYKRVLWEKSVKKACNDIGIISDSFAYNILTLNLIERCYLFSNDCTIYTLYYDFMITFCVELFDFLILNLFLSWVIAS